MNIRDFVINGFAVLRGILRRFRFRKCGSLLRIERGVRLWTNNGQIIVGDRVLLHRFCKLSAYGAGEKAEIIIGSNTYIGDRTEIHAGKKVEIGNGCDISWDCNILDRDYHKLDGDAECIKPVRICDNVWMGCGCTVLKGVTVGEGAVIAAGSVVTKDVAPHTLVGGNPARVIRENVNWRP